MERESRLLLAPLGQESASLRARTGADFPSTLARLERNSLSMAAGKAQESQCRRAAMRLELVPPMIARTPLKAVTIPDLSWAEGSSLHQATRAPIQHP